MAKCVECGGYSVFRYCSDCSYRAYYKKLEGLNGD